MPCIVGRINRPTLPDIVSGAEINKGWNEMSKYISYAAEVRVVNDQKWYKNSLRFACPAYAESYGRDLMSRWFAVTEFRVVETIDKPTNRDES